jgi:hypothetical protein
MEALGATNIRLRWSREKNGSFGCYKHSAPLEPGGKSETHRTAGGKAAGSADSNSFTLSTRCEHNYELNPGSGDKSAFPTSIVMSVPGST